MSGVWDAMVGRGENVSRSMGVRFAVIRARRSCKNKGKLRFRGEAAVNRVKARA